jgi:hypothetical protein
MTTTLLKNSYWKPLIETDENGDVRLIDGIEVPISDTVSNKTYFVKDEKFVLVRPYDTDSVSTCYYYVIKNKEGIEYIAFASDFTEIYEEEK